MTCHSETSTRSHIAAGRFSDHLPVADFDRLVGLAYLRGMHLNDSKGALGSRKDRHENIGMYVVLSALRLREVDVGNTRGELGIAAFAHIVSEPRTQGIPLVLETPSSDTIRAVWSTEVAALNALAAAETLGEEVEVRAQEISGVVNQARGAIVDKPVVKTQVPGVAESVCNDRAYIV
jgi:AP endonuclease-1